MTNNKVFMLFENMVFVKLVKNYVKKNKNIKFNGLKCSIDYYHP